MDKVESRRAYMKEYHQGYKGNLSIQTTHLYRDICPKCGKRGRFSLKIKVNKLTGTKTFSSIEIQHFEYNKLKKMKAYSHTCYICGNIGKEILEKYNER